MAKNHLKRITTPKTWPIERKATVFITRPQTGAHSLKTGLPISIILKDELKLVRLMRGVKYLLNTQEVLVNGRRVRRPNVSVGLMDVLSFPAIKTHYRILINKWAKLFTLPIAGEEIKVVPSKITRKTARPKGKIQLGFHNGKSLLIAKGKYKTGDTLLLTITNEIKEQLPLEKEASVLLTGGRHVGLTGKLKELEKKVVVETSDGLVETVIEHVFVIGKKSPSIKMAGKNE